MELKNAINLMLNGIMPNKVEFTLNDDKKNIFC